MKFFSPVGKPPARLDMSRSYSEDADNQEENYLYINELIDKSKGEFIAFVMKDSAWFTDEDSVDNAMESLNYTRIGAYQMPDGGYKLLYVHDSYPYTNPPLLLTAHDGELVLTDPKSNEKVEFAEAINVSSIEVFDLEKNNDSMEQMIGALNFFDQNRFYDIATKSFETLEEFNKIAKGLYR